MPVSITPAHPPLKPGDRIIVNGNTDPNQAAIYLRTVFSSHELDTDRAPHVEYVLIDVDPDTGEIYTLRTHVSTQHHTIDTYTDDTPEEGF